MFSAVCALVLLAAFPSAGADGLRSGSSTGFPDVKGHWASGAIERWAQLGVLKGDSRGFRPDDPITVAEMSVLLERLMGYSEPSDGLSEADGSRPWYEHALLAAASAGAFDTMDMCSRAAGDWLTREEAVTVLASALGVEENSGNETRIADAGLISPDRQLLVFGMEAAGYVRGTGNRSFSPLEPATRAQVVEIIDRAVRAFYDTPGVYADYVAPSGGVRRCVAIVSAASVTLDGSFIEGDLIVAEGIGGGTFRMMGSTVAGNLIIRGGEGALIGLSAGSEIRGRASVQGTSGPVRLVYDGPAQLSVDVTTTAALEGYFKGICTYEGSYTKLSGSARAVSLTGRCDLFLSAGSTTDELLLFEAASGSRVEIYGSVGLLRLEAPGSSVSAYRGSSIGTIDAKPGCGGSDIFLSRYASVGLLSCDARITLSGSGSPGSIDGSADILRTYTVQYSNEEFGFSFTLPEGWSGYSVVRGSWHAYPVAEGAAEAGLTGAVISIRHPLWTEWAPRQDIPIMTFSTDEWISLEKGDFHIGAAPIGPHELGRNTNYVFALPARYNFSFLEGYEEVERILRSDPLLAF